MCYRKDVTELLAQRQGLLSTLYSCASAGGAGGGKGGMVAGKGGMTKAEGEMLNLGEWKCLLRGLDLIGPDLSECDATLCFAWSRMVVIDDSTARGRLRETHLPYEGFLEALCRVSTLMALPTDAEIEAASCRDAGAFVEELKARDGLSYVSMQQERKVAWGETPPQPEERCVAHLMALVTRRLELRAGSLSMESVRKWCRQTLALAES